MEYEVVDKIKELCIEAPKKKYVKKGRRIRKNETMVT